MSVSPLWFSRLDGMLLVCGRRDWAEPVSTTWDTPPKEGGASAGCSVEDSREAREKGSWETDVSRDSVEWWERFSENEDHTPSPSNMSSSTSGGVSADC